MRPVVLCVILSIAVCLGSSSPIERARYLVYRPKLYRRSPQNLGIMYVKGQSPGSKAYNPMPPPQLRKGQYMCGNKVCRLKPGEIPQGCDGMCQHAVS